MSIVSFGSINIDLTTYAGRLPAPGETLHGKDYRIGLGGKGCNQAVAAARLGSAALFVGRVGGDSFGELARNELRSAGVPDGQLMTDATQRTGLGVIGVDEAGTNAITVIAGANDALTTDDVERSAAVLDAARVLLLQLEVPVVASIAAAKRVSASGGLVILDPAPVPAAGVDLDLLRAADIVTPNEVEAEALTGIRPSDEESAAEVAEALIAMGARGVVLTMGEFGCYAALPDLRGRIPAFDVTVVDTVAAGDCFNGGLAHAIGAGMAMDRALAFANACGAACVTRRGAADAAPGPDDLVGLLGS